MRRLWMTLAMAIAAAFALVATPAAAQATRTWVSGVGDDANPCSRTAPCKTFQGAISKTAAGGEISVLDPGGYGAVTITKSISIRSIGLEAGVLVAAQNGIIINAGVNDRVVLQGLDIEGLGNANQASIHGVQILSAGDVLIEDSTIHGFNSPISAGVMVDTSTTTRVVISNSILHSNATAVKVVSTGGTGHANVMDSLVQDNGQGLVVDGAGNTLQLANNRIFGPAALVMLNGGITKSYGGNLIPAVASVPSQTIATK